MIEQGIATEKTPLIKYDQSFYIFEDGKTEMDKIYKFENISELEKDMNITLPKINVGSYSKEEYYKDYTSYLIDRVRIIYARDFRNLGYSDEFT